MQLLSESLKYEVSEWQTKFFGSTAAHNFTTAANQEISSARVNVEL